MNPARLAAVRSLVSIRKSQRYANLELDSFLKKSNLSERDSALFTTLVYGVIEREITLDHYISKFCNRRAHALSPFLRATLQCGLYQLEYFTNTPVRAVLFESAEIAKSTEKQAGANLVSAVLHAFLRAKEAGEDLLCGLSEITQRSVRYAIPEWMISLWDNAYGKEKCDAVCQSFSVPSKTCLHTNTLKTTSVSLLTELEAQGIAASLHPDNHDLILLNDAHGDLRRLESYGSGHFFAQDYSSACAVQALAPRPGETVAHVCRAPGGKAFAAALKMQNQGIIYASDLHENRTKLIEKGAERLGLHCLNVSARDARKSPDVLIGKMDRVLCDVPCSGLGVIGKKADLRHKTAEEIKNLPTIQLDILREAAKLLKPGGRLVYSTCTLNPEENEGVVDTFLKNTPCFSLVGSPRTLFPCDGVQDGFFFVALEKMQ